MERNPVGRPREYATAAERQAAYRQRRKREDCGARQALARLREVIKAARSAGRVLSLDPRAVDAEHDDATLVRSLVFVLAAQERDGRRGPR